MKSPIRPSLFRRSPSVEFSNAITTEGSVKSFQATASAIGAGCRVKLNSGGLMLVAGADDPAIGVTLEPVNANGRGPVKLFTGQGTFTLATGGAITRGTQLYASANGVVDASGSALLNLIALESSTSAGDLIECAFNDLGAGSGTMTRTTQGTPSLPTEHPTAPVDNLSYVFGGRDTIDLTAEQIDQETHAFGFLGDRSAFFAGRQYPGSFVADELAQYSVNMGWNCLVYASDNDAASTRGNKHKGGVALGYHNYNGGGPATFSAGMYNTVAATCGFVAGAQNLIGYSYPFTALNNATKTLSVTGVDLTASLTAGKMFAIRALHDTVEDRTDANRMSGYVPSHAKVVSSTYTGGHTIVTFDRALADGAVDYGPTGLLTIPDWQAPTLSLFSGALGYRNQSYGRGALAVGDTNTAAGDATLATGYGSKASHRGSQSWSARPFRSVGDDQIIRIPVSNWTGTAFVLNTAKDGFLITTDAGATGFGMPRKSSAGCKAFITGKRVDVGTPSGTSTPARAIGQFVRELSFLAYTPATGPSSVASTLSQVDVYSTASVTCTLTAINIIENYALNIVTGKLAAAEVYGNGGGLSNLGSITGLSYNNTSAPTKAADGTVTGGCCFLKVVDDTGGFFHLDLYKDAALTSKVAHTATFNTDGAKTWLPDNSSGLGGTATVTAASMAAQVATTVEIAYMPVVLWSGFIDAAVITDTVA